MLQTETVRFYPELGKEYKYLLRLADYRGEPNWEFYVLERDKIDVEGKNLTPPEKNFNKFLDWKMTSDVWPRDYEMVFSIMKEEVFSILQKFFLRGISDYKKDFFEGGPKINNSQRKTIV